VLGLFAVALAWLNNYSTQFRQQDLLYPQQKTLASQLALLAGEAFALNESIVFEMPCFVLEGKGVPFWVYGGGLEGETPVAGAKEITVLSVVYAKKQSVETVFPVSAEPNPLVFECPAGEFAAGKISFERNEDGIVLKKIG